MQCRKASVAEILDSQRLDPEEFLEDLGFSGPDCSLLCRLPSRFLSTTQRDQRLCENFHSLHPEFKENEQTEANAAITETYSRLPTYYRTLEPSEACTSLHKMVASAPPPAQKLSRGVSLYSYLQIPQKAKPSQSSHSNSRRRASLKVGNLTTIGETEISSTWSLAPSSIKSLSSCDVTDESSEEELSPIILNCRVPKFTYPDYCDEDEMEDSVELQLQTQAFCTASTGSGSRENTWEWLNGNSSGERSSRESAEERTIMAGKKKRLRRKISGERSRRDSIGERLSRDSIGERLSRDSIGERLSRDSIGERLSRDSIGERLSRDSIGERLSRDSIAETDSITREIKSYISITDNSPQAETVASTAACSHNLHTSSLSVTLTQLNSVHQTPEPEDCQLDDRLVAMSHWCANRTAKVDVDVPDAEVVESNDINRVNSSYVSSVSILENGSVIDTGNELNILEDGGNPTFSVTGIRTLMVQDVNANRFIDSARKISRQECVSLTDGSFDLHEQRGKPKECGNTVRCTQNSQNRAELHRNSTHTSVGYPSVISDDGKLIQRKSVHHSMISDIPDLVRSPCQEVHCYSNS